MQNDYQNAIKEILKGVAYLLAESAKQNTQCYDGIIIGDNGNGRWNVQYNGETHSLKPYGSIVPSIGSMVKVIIPQGNTSVAFFI